MFNALYYPFSRCVNVNVIKKYLLIFDSITFLDAVSDESWRNDLFRTISADNPLYKSYSDVFSSIQILKEEGCLEIKNPFDVASINDGLTIEATLADLSDPAWVAAANPKRFGLYTLKYNQEPSWQIFNAKIPKKIEEHLLGRTAISKHLLRAGDTTEAWELSYAAGSSLGINTHLAAASEIGASVVTDSPLHHELLLRKLYRKRTELSFNETSDIHNLIFNKLVLSVLNSLVPDHVLDKISIDDIINFRNETRNARHEFVLHVQRISRAEIDMEKANDIEKIVAKVSDQIIKSCHDYRKEIASVRDRFWPKCIEGLIAPAPLAASAAALAASYITNSTFALVASIGVGALPATKTLLDWRADLKKADRAPGSLAYLTLVTSMR